MCSWTKLIRAEVCTSTWVIKFRAGQLLQLCLSGMGGWCERPDPGAYIVKFRSFGLGPGSGVRVNTTHNASDHLYKISAAFKNEL